MATNQHREKFIYQLIKGCLKNDRDAQKKLYQEYYSYGMSICIRYVGDREEAVEVLNDSYMKVFKNIAKYDSKYPFKAWFRRILINESINTIKRKSGKFNEESLEGMVEPGMDNSIISDIGHTDVLEMIQQLPPQYKAVFNLHTIEGYTHEEIGKMLSISNGTSKSNLFKAKEKLKVLLNDYMEVGDE